MLTITALTGDDLLLEDGNANGEVAKAIGTAGPVTFSNFENLDLATGVEYEATATQPTGATAYGTYWYDTNFDVDLLVKENGGTGWIELASQGTPGEVFVQADAPTTGVSDRYLG